MWMACTEPLLIEDCRTRHIHWVVQINALSIEPDLQSPFDEFSVGLPQIVGEINIALDPVAILQDNDRTAAVLQNAGKVLRRCLHHRLRDADQIPLLDII